jgi:hypothetical protein
MLSWLASITTGDHERCRHQQLPPHPLAPRGAFVGRGQSNSASLITHLRETGSFYPVGAELVIHVM